MSRVIAAATLAASFNARFNHSGTVDLSAAGEVVFPSDPDSSLDTVQAAGVRSFTAPGRMQWVKVVEPFLVLGETILVDEYVELPENDAKYLKNRGTAQFATAEEVAAAQKQQKAGK